MTAFHVMRQQLRTIKYVNKQYSYKNKCYFVSRENLLDGSKGFVNSTFYILLRMKFIVAFHSIV